MFKAVTSNFHWSEPSTLATLHDRPWTGKELVSVGNSQPVFLSLMLQLKMILQFSVCSHSDGNGGEKARNARGKC